MLSDGSLKKAEPGDVIAGGGDPGLQLLVERPMYWDDEIEEQRSLLGPDGGGHLG